MFSLLLPVTDIINDKGVFPHPLFLKLIFMAARVADVKILIDYIDNGTYGDAKVEIESQCFEDEVIAFAFAVAKDDHLRTLVTESLCFLMSPEFRAMAQSQGL